jgi:hypothetical protein
MDLTRSKPELVLENGILRQQVTLPKRQVKCRAFTGRHCVPFVLLTGKLQMSKQAPVIVQP